MSAKKSRLNFFCVYVRLHLPCLQSLGFFWIVFLSLWIFRGIELEQLSLRWSQIFFDDVVLSCLRSFHTAGLSELTIVSINAWPGKMCMFCLFRPTSLTKQCWHHLYTSDAFGSWGTSLCHVGWCSVKTNKQEKKKKGRRKIKRQKQYPQVFGCS